MIIHKKKTQTGPRYKILMIVSELAPFAQISTYAQSVVHISAALVALGHDVRIVMPRYYNIDRTDMKKHRDPIGVFLGETEQWCTLYHAVLPQTDIPVYLLDHEQFFGRNGLYGPQPGVAYDDNAQRFTFFCSAVFQLCRALQWIPDIMHSHDWATGLVNVFLYTKEEDTDFSETASVFSVHNIDQQGIFDNEDFVYTSLSKDDLYISKMEKDGKLNFLHGALAQADMITAASAGYAKEICTKELGAGLDILLKSRSSDLVGVLNGIDYRLWNPAKDKFLLPISFSEKDLKNKIKAKKLLQKELNLLQDAKLPIIIMHGDFSHKQRAFDLLFGDSNAKLYDICEKLKVQFIISGKFNPVYEEELTRLQDIRSNFRLYQDFDEAKLHLLFAGADFLLLPNEYEPFCATQIYSLRYGTLPIVHNSGCMGETVVNFAADATGATGFIFNEMTQACIFDTVSTAVSLYYNNPKSILAMQKQAMMQRFGWEESAKDYLLVYQSALDRRQGRLERTWGDDDENAMENTQDHQTAPMEQKPSEAPSD